MVRKDLCSQVPQVALDSSQCGSPSVAGHQGQGLHLSLLHPSSFLLRGDVVFAHLRSSGLWLAPSPNRAAFTQAFKHPAGLEETSWPVNVRALLCTS